MGWLIARFYDRMTRASEEAGLREWRRDLLTSASGEGLEIGAGTGLNLGHYGEAVTGLQISEPDPHMRAQLKARAAESGHAGFEVSGAGAEEIPLPDCSLDFVVATLVICTVRDPDRSLREIFRVLRPGGHYLFLEHVAHEPPRSDRWQRWLEPLWKRMMGNCHLTRRTGASICAVGFEIESMQNDDMPKGLGVVRSTIRGLARKPG